MQRRILASLLALCVMGGMLQPAVLATAPGEIMSTIQKLEKRNGVPAASAELGAAGNSSEPVLDRVGEGKAPTNGICGENLTWNLDLKTGILEISGTGEMEDYSKYGPWYDYSDSIKEIKFSGGITSIGDKAFRGYTGHEYPNLKK